MINLHFTIAGVFLLIGFCMRFGLWQKLVVYAYERIPKLNRNKFDEFEVRRFVGETSIKLGVIILTIALVGVFDKKDFNLAMLLGWICLILYAFASVTFADKIDIFDKYRKARQKAKIEQMKSMYEAASDTDASSDQGISRNIKSEEPEDTE